MNKTALVTGATGFIGSYLVRFLRSKGWKVIGSYRSRDSDSLPKLPNLQFVQCDLRNRPQIKAAVENARSDACLSLGRAELTHAILGGSGYDFRVERRGIPSPI